MHGLNGDPQRTWTSEETSVFWPAQLLPPILEEEKVRIMVYGYDADVTSFTDGVSRDKIHNHAEHLVAELAANRRVGFPKRGLPRTRCCEVAKIGADTQSHGAPNHICCPFTRWFGCQTSEWLEDSCGA